MSQEYIEKLEAKREECRAILKSKGLYVEDMAEEIGLIISLTQFGLSTIYANLPQSELEYILDNDVEL